MTADEKPMFHLDLSDANAPQLRLKSEELSDFERAMLKKVKEDPKHQARVQRLMEVAARGAPALAIADDALPAGELARVILDRSAADPRMIVVNEAGFTDEILQRANEQLTTYELSNADSPERIQLSLLTDGSVRVTRGDKVGVYRPSAVTSPAEDRGYARKILKRAEKVERTNLKGVGAARVLALGGKRGSEP